MNRRVNEKDDIMNSRLKAFLLHHLRVLLERVIWDKP